MDDREIVAALAAGDPDGLAGAYDRYAAPLYGYCWSMLPEASEAAEAVRDTFTLAVRQLGRIRDPGKVRSWLFSTARTECLRRSRAAKPGIDEAGEAVRAGGVADAGGVTGGLADAGGVADLDAATADGLAGARREAQWAELRKLIRVSLARLTPDEREAVELSLWHDLDDTDLAAVFDVSRPRAYALATNGRRQLERGPSVPCASRVQGASRARNWASCWPAGTDG
jgi:RNA polymerase sigma factor (sigma-70 family)